MIFPRNWISHRVWLLILCFSCFSLYGSLVRAEVAAWLLMDADNGQVIEHNAAFDSWYPASLTKMMTAYLTFHQLRSGGLRMNDLVTVSQNALNQPPSKMGFKVGTTVTIDNALKMILVKSANDISVALAERVGGNESNFVSMMNVAAGQLGMRDTVFVNPHGLPDNRQVTTARDMAVLSHALWAEFPQYHEYVKYAGIRFGRRTFRSGNKEFLLRTEGANGLKTGYICNAGYNVATSVTRHGRTLIAVVLGAGSTLERSAFAKKLIDLGFSRHRGGVSIVNLRGSGQRTPPADNYCKRNTKPSAQELVDRFGTQNSTSSMLGYSSYDSTGPKGKSVRLSENKINWPLVYEEILGPQLEPYAPVTVRAGGERPMVGLKRLGSHVPLPPLKPDATGISYLNRAPAGGIQRFDPVGKGAPFQPINNMQSSELFGAPGGLYAKGPLSSRTP